MKERDNEKRNWDNREANRRAVEMITDAQPYWVGVEAAGTFLKEMGEHTILHSGPPIPYEAMCGLHKRGMQNGALMEGWAADRKEADRLLKRGDIRVDSALNYNTVGSGTGIITPSVPLLIVEDRRTGKRAGVFPAEGKFGGGFCGWGIYSGEIADNLRYLRERIFAPLCRLLEEEGGLELKSLIAESIQMGDENHSSQSAVDLLFLKKILPYGLKAENSEEILCYFLETARFFHNFGQAASRSALLGASGIQGSSMVTVAGGNGVEFGIKVAGLGEEWFTAPSPMIEGRYMAQGSRREDQLAWIGDSSVVECAGLGGILSAASPRVCAYRGDNLEKALETTRQMSLICIGENPSYRIPSLDFAHPPVGIDVLKCVKTRIAPVINGGMINRQGGWMGAGCARIPMECFEKAAKAYEEKYGV